MNNSKNYRNSNANTVLSSNIIPRENLRRHIHMMARLSCYPNQQVPHGRGRF